MTTRRAAAVSTVEPTLACLDLIVRKTDRVDYSITLSARCSTLWGIVRPIALAVLRLMTSSNFAGSSTGKSEGRAPFRIRST